MGRKHFYRWRKPQRRRVIGAPGGHRAHTETGCDPGQRESKAVSPHLVLALEGRGGAIGSLWYPIQLGLSFLGPGDESGIESRPCRQHFQEEHPFPRLLSHRFLPTGKSLGFFLSLKPLLVPWRHRLGLSRSYLRMGLSDSALGAKSQRALDGLKKGTFGTPGNQALFPDFYMSFWAGIKPMI